MSIKSSVFIVAAVALVGACTNNLETVRETTVSGNDFQKKLASDYKDFALYEGDAMYDWPDADFFARKALAANAGSDVQPENPDNWGIGNDAKMAELKTARARLMQAMAKDAASKVPALAARAQVKYDCWVEQQEEGWQRDHIAACKEGFEKAMARLDSAMTPQLASAAPPPPAPAPAPLPSTFVVYFPFDSAQIEPSQEPTIAKAIDAFKKRGPVRVLVEGHADRSGPASYNQDLSVERGKAIQAALSGQGVPSSLIAVEGEGETEPAVITRDGVRHPANRRVRIMLQ